eukprot:235512_1
MMLHFQRFFISAFFVLSDIMESFKHCDQQIKLTNNNHTITNNGDGSNIAKAWGTLPIASESKGVNQWRFKIIFLNPINGCICIGIRDGAESASYPPFVYGYRTDGYQWNSCDGGYTADRLKDGDIILMTLNMNNKTVSFCINNDKAKQTVFTVKNVCKQYKMVISTNYYGDSISLLSYKYAEQVTDNNLNVSFTENQVDIEEKKEFVHKQQHDDDKDQFEARLDSLTSKVDELSKQLNDIRLLLTEEQKDDNLSDIKKEMEMMKQNIQNLMDRNNSPKPEKENAVNVWLRDVVKLPEYIDLFMQNGMDDMTVIEDITMNELNQIGIDKLGHKMRILKAVAKLKPTEGDTPYV